MAHKSLCRIIRNGPLKISKSLKKAENGPFGKNPLPNHCCGKILTLEIMLEMKAETEVKRLSLEFSHELVMLEMINIQHPSSSYKVSQY